MHTSLQGQQEKKIDILEKELTNKDWLMYRDGLWIWTGVTKNVKKKNLHGCFEIEKKVLGGRGEFHRLSLLSTQSFFVSSPKA